MKAVCVPPGAYLLLMLCSLAAVLWNLKKSGLATQRDRQTQRAVGLHLLLLLPLMMEDVLQRLQT
jgi:hypothetical protein